MDLLQTENFKIFAWWSQILVLKMLAMVVLTAIQRTRKNVSGNRHERIAGKKTIISNKIALSQVWASPEDVKYFSGGKVSGTDPDVERVRKAHRNDLENILPWFICTFLWLTTSPGVGLVKILIPVFALSRIAHTLVYAVFLIPQPARAIAFFIAYFVMAYQAISTVIYYVL